MSFTRIPWAPSIGAALKLKSVSLADTLPAVVAEAAYLFGNTPDNEESVLRGGIAVTGKKLQAVGLYLCGGDPYRATPDGPIAYAGFNAWRERLLETDWTLEQFIHEVPRSQNPWHTGTEAREFIKLAKHYRWKRALLIAPPFHMLRAFLNAVSQAIRQDVSVRLYCAPGPAQPWHEKALYSQGFVTQARIDLEDGEWERITRWYGNDLDLVPYEEVMSYLRWRDSDTKAPQ